MIEKKKSSKNTATRWEQVYKDNPLGSLPWEEGGPSPQLVKIVESGAVEPGPVLDICTGSGNNAIYLAEHGFACSGIDISATAINHAREKSIKAGVACDFRVGDVLDLPFSSDTFSLVFDRGCFHSVTPGQRVTFIREICRILRTRGKYQLICFSKKSHRWSGPPYSFSPSDIQRLFSPTLKILEIKEISNASGDSRDLFLSVLMEKPVA